MAKRDFDAFYYGVGMKLDDKSINQAAEKLEGRLNQVVDNVTREVKKIALAVNSGIKEIDTTGLNNAIKEVGMDLDNLVDFNPKKLKTQVSQLESDFQGLAQKIGDMSSKMETSFNSVTELVDKVSTRLANIEITTSKDGIRAFKSDLEMMADYAQKMLNSGEIDSSGIDKYLKRVKNGFASLKASGNPMELFADKDIAKYFVNISTMLRDMGAPVEDLRVEFFELSSVFKEVFEKTNLPGAQNVFKGVKYQIEEINHSLQKARLNIAEYEAEIAKLENGMRDWHKVTNEGDQALIDAFQTKQTLENLDAIITKIEEYQSKIISAPKNSPDLQSYERLIALAQTAEGVMSNMGKKKAKPLLETWADRLSGVTDLTDYKINDFSVDFLGEYREVLQKMIDGIRNAPEYQELQKIIGEQTIKLESLIGKKSSKSTSSKKGTDVARATGEKFIVSPELKIDAKKWTQQINDTLSAISNPETGKLKPIDIKINTQNKQLEENLKQIWDSIEKTLKGTRNVRKKDAEGNPISAYETAFDSSFESFIKKLKEAKIQLIDFIDKEWKHELKEAFSFNMKVDGQSKTEAKTQVGAFITTYIDALNDAIKDKPVELKSNIDALIEEIKTKTQNIQIGGGQVDLKVGDIELPKQNIGNLMLSVDTGDLAKDDTVRKIYNLLSVRKGDGTSPYDSRITELKRLIAEQEASERKVLNIVESKTATEQKGAEAVEKKVEAEKTTETPKTTQTQFTSSSNKKEQENTSTESQEKNKDKSKKQTSKADKNTEETAEEILARRLKKAQEITQYTLKLAKWAQALGQIADGLDYTITEADFKDRDIVKRNGVAWTKDDLYKEGRNGTIFSRGHKTSAEDIDKFIAEYEKSEDEEYKQLFGFVKELIDARRASQTRLNETLKSLKDTDIVDKYNASEDKPEYLAKNIKAYFGRLMGKNANTDAQLKVSEAFNVKGVVGTRNFEDLANEKDPTAMFKLIQDWFASADNLDEFFKALPSMNGKLGKSYESFVGLLKIAREFIATSDATQTIGQEARKLIGGTREQRDKYRKEFDPRTGRTIYTDEVIGVKSEVIEKGFRQMIQDFSAIFVDEAGNKFGFNDGKGVVDPENFLGVGKSTGFNKIIKFLETVLNNAIDIQVSGQRGFAKDYNDLNKHERIGDMKSQIPDYKPGIIKRTESEKVAGQIQNAQKIREDSEKELQRLKAEMQATVSEAENVNKILELSTQKSAKKQSFDSQKNKVENIQSEIRKLESRLTNPAESFENIATQLLQKQEALLEIEKEYNKMPHETLGDEMARDKVKEQIKQKKSEIRHLQEKANASERSYLLKTLLNLIDQEEASLKSLEQTHSEKKSNANLISTREKITGLENQRKKLLATVDQLRNEKNAVKPQLDSKQQELMQKFKEAIAEVDKQLESTSDIIKTLEGKKVSADNKELVDAKNTQQELEQRKQRLINNARAVQNNPKGQYSAEQLKVIQEKENQIQQLLKQIYDLSSEEEQLRRMIAPAEEDIQDLTKLINLKRKHLEFLRKGLHKTSALSTKEINTQLTAKTQELAQAQAEQDKLEAEYTLSQTLEKDAIDKELEILRAQKATKEARIKEIDATKDSVNNAKLQAERQSLETEIAQIDRHINDGLIHTIRRITEAMRVVQENLDRANQALVHQETKLKEADKVISTYTKDGKTITRADAETFLPQAQARLEHEEAMIQNAISAYVEKRAMAINKPTEMAIKGDLAVEEAERMTKAMISLSEITERFKRGEIEKSEYIAKLTASYVAMQQATGKVNEELARTDATNLADAIQNVQTLKNDIVLLNEIITGKIVAPISKPQTVAKSQQTEEKAKTIEVTKQKQEEKQKTAETKKQKTAEKAKTEEVKKQVELEKAKTTEVKRHEETSNNQSNDVILGTQGKDMGEFWKAYRLMTQEIAEGKRVFREHGFYARDNKISKVYRGVYAHTSGVSDRTADTYGHFHPNNTLFSDTDINSTKLRKERNSNFDATYLFTPDYVHKLTGLKNISTQAIDELTAQFKKIQQASLSVDMTNSLKENLLIKLAQNNQGAQYTKQTINSDGTTTDITDTIRLFEKDVFDKIIQWGQTQQQIRDMAKKRLSKTQEYKDLVEQNQKLYEELMKNEGFAAINPRDTTKNTVTTNALSDKSRAATMIQTAVDADLDLSLFINQFKDYFDSMRKLKEVIPNDSPLAKLSSYIDQINTAADDVQKNTLIEQMKPYLFDVFKKNKQLIIDDRVIKHLQPLVSQDKTGRIAKIIDSVEKKQPTISDKEELGGGAIPTLAELKAELATLEAKRDAETVDPRFATVEKQEEIIRILNAGIKVNGKLTADKSDSSVESGSEKSTKETKKKAPKIPTIGKVDLQTNEIKALEGNINKEWDVYKNYQAAKEQLNRAIESAKAKGKDFTPEDADQIRAIRDQVLHFGQDVIKASNAMSDLKARSQDAMGGVKMGITNVREDMLSMVHERAVATQSLISDVSFDDEKQRMTAVLTDMEGQTTRLTMNYYEMFNAIVTNSDKTSDSVRKIYKAIEGEMQKMVEAQNLISDEIGNPKLQNSTAFTEYSNSYNKMLESANNIRQKGTLATKEEKEELIALRKQVETTRMAFEKMAKASSDFDAKVGKNVIGMNDSQSLEIQMKNFVLNSQAWSASQRRMIEETWRFNEAQNSASYSVEKNKGQLASMSVIADDGTKRIGQYTEETKKYKSGMEKFMDSLKNKWQEVARYLMTFGSMYRLFATLKQGLQYVKEIDTALTELKKVTNETERAYDKFLKTAAKTANKVGSTIKEIVSSTADWARIGYSMKEAAALAESTAILLNVSEFQSIDEATSALTSTLQAFGYTAKQSMNVVDVLNEVGNNFAVSSDGIATALKDSASSLVAANNSYEEAVALIASANRVVQDPNSVGAALRTISLRLRGTSTKELEEAGEDTTGVVESKSKLRTKIQGYTGVDILTDTGAYKSTYEILLEISKVWDDLTDQDQAGLLELIAGKTRSNTAAAILSNTKDLEAALRAAEEAEGSALRENEKYMQSIQGRIDLFNNAIQTMWSNTLDDEVVKDVVNLGTELVKIIDDFGLIKALIMAIGSVLIKKNFKGDLFGGMLSTKTLGDTKLKLQALRTEYEKAQQAYDANHTKSNKRHLDKAKTKYDEYNGTLSPIIKEYDQLTAKSTELTDQLDGLQAKRQSLVTELSNSQANEDFLGKRMAAGYDGAAEAMDKARENSQKLQEQIQQVDQEIVNTQTEITNTETELRNVEEQAKKTGAAGATAGQKIKAGFKSATKAVLDFGKQMLKSMAYMFIITTVIELLGTGVRKLIELISGADESFEALHKKFEEARSEVESLKSEIESLESELDQTNKQIEELAALENPTFVEQEELERLRSVTEELRAQIDLKNQLQGNLQKGANDATIIAANKYMDTSFANEKSRTEVQEEAAEDWGVWGKLLGVALTIGGLALAPFSAGTSTGATALGLGMLGLGLSAEPIMSSIGSATAGSNYDAEESVGEAIANMNKQRDELIKARDEALAAYADGSGSKEAYESAEQELTAYNANLAQSIAQIAEYRNAIMSDIENATPDQLEQAKAWGDIIDAYNISMGGKGAKEAAINRVFSDGKALGEFEEEKKEIDKYIEALKNGDESAAQSIANLINSNQALKDAFSAKTLDPQDAIDYFTKLGQEANFATIEGKTEDIRKATEKLGSAFNNVGQFITDGKVDNVAIADYFKGTSEATRKEIARLVKNIHDGKMSVEQAMKSFAAFGMLESWKIIETEVSELNTEVFKDLGEDISGIINTVKELSSAFESVASSIDLVSQAEAEMAYSGHLSVETALQLMESTDDWNEVLKIENGNIKLVEGAEDALVQTKLDLIKTNLQTALSTVEAQLAQLDATSTNLDMATTIEESTNVAVRELSGNMAYLTTMMTAYTKAAAGEKVDMAKVTEEAEKAKAAVLDATNYEKNAATEVGREELLKEKERLQTMLEVYGTVDNRSKFKGNYSSDEVSGGNADKDSAEDDLFQKEMDYWENRIAANQAKYEQLQNEIDLLEAKGQKVDMSFYEEQIKLEKEREWLLGEQKKAAEARLKAIEDAGGEGSEAWWEVANTLNDIEGELDDVTASIVDLQDAIGEIDTYKFEEFNNRLNNLTSKLETIRNLIAPDGEEDWFDDEGNWTEAGVAVLGSNVQELEMYKKGYQETMDELAKYEPDYENNKAYYEALGIHSEQEWYDKTEDLISQQYDFAESISDTEQSIVDMYESNIDAVEEYTESLITNYNDYIDSVKEALDAERDLYDFKKNVQKQAKDIADIERRIASLSGSTNASDIAERRKLEAQLYESRESLNDTYYDHAKNAQSEALDKEAEAYETSMNNMIEGLRTSLEEATLNMDEFLMGVTSMVMYNAETVYNKYQETNLPLTTELTNPWIKAKEAVGNYSGNALDLMNQWTKEGGFFAQFNTSGTTNLQSPWSAGTTAANSFKTSVSTVMSGVVSNIATNVKTASGELSKLYQQIQDTEARASSANVVISGSGGGGSSSYVAPQKKYYVTAFLDMGSRSLSVTKSDSNAATAMSAAKIAILGEYEKVKGNSASAENAWLRSWRNKVKYTTQYYSKGTTGTPRDEWAITDEPRFGDELTMYATPEGTLSFMRTGSTVVPADITANLVEWGKLNPDMLNINGTPNINMISNAINKPELNITFDSLIKAENITEETLPAVKKLVTQELNRFTKELNYALKGKGAR